MDVRPLLPVSAIISPYRTDNRICVSPGWTDNRFFGYCRSAMAQKSFSTGPGISGGFGSDSNKCKKAQNFQSDVTYLRRQCELLKLIR